ncbi:MAG: SAM-dependent DNA methyltransferase, partial [Proteobacteria bacterium]
MNSTVSLVDKLWRYCNVLRDDGMSYGDYVEQLTYLLFLKMAEEHSKPPFLYLDELDAEFRWSAITREADEEQHERYEKILWELSQRKDLFGAIYKGAISKFRDPKKFHRLISEISSVSWSEYESDVKGDAYEGLLERTAAEGKAGAGQYFTARPLVDAIVQVMDIRPGMSICDPACGTGGFLLETYKHVLPLCQGKEQEKRLKEYSIYGVELVESVARLCLMNLVLHGIGGKDTPVSIQDSLATMPVRQFDIVLANPPFGRQSSSGTGRDSESSGSSDLYQR